MLEQRVLNLPLETDEVIAIILQRIEARMRSNCFFSHAATYNGFSYDLEMKVKFNDMMQNRDTLVWDRHTDGEVPLDAKQEVIVEKYDSGESPNRARQEHDLELPVQVQEGKKTVIKKMRFPKAGAAA
jgi:hypothetical protein